MDITSKDSPVPSILCLQLMISRGKSSDGASHCHQGIRTGSKTFVQNYAQAAGLIPGLYKVRAIFESRGIDANIYFNPLLGNAKELEGLRPQDWKGLIQSNELTIRMVARR
jgi:hypothetical protein